MSPLRAPRQPIETMSTIMKTVRIVAAAGAVALLAATQPFTDDAIASETHNGALAYGVEMESGFAHKPPAPWGESGPADSLYRLGREAIIRGDFKRAASLFA